MKGKQMKLYFDNRNITSWVYVKLIADNEVMGVFKIYKNKVFSVEIPEQIDNLKLEFSGKRFCDYEKFDELLVEKNSGVMLPNVDDDLSLDSLRILPEWQYPYVSVISLHGHDEDMILHPCDLPQKNLKGGLYYRAVRFKDSLPIDMKLERKDFDVRMKQRRRTELMWRIPAGILAAVFCSFAIFRVFSIDMIPFERRTTLLFALIMFIGTVYFLGTAKRFLFYECIFNEKYILESFQLSDMR